MERLQQQAQPEAPVTRAYWIRGDRLDPETLMPQFYLGVEVRCPRCARTHTHGAINVASPTPEHRVPHCAGRISEKLDEDPNDPGGYYIVGLDRVEIPPDPREEIAEMRRHTGDPLTGMPRRMREQARPLLHEREGALWV